MLALETVANVFMAAGRGQNRQVKHLPCISPHLIGGARKESLNTLSDLRRDAEGCGRGRPRSPILPHRAGLEMGGLAGKWRRRKNI